MPCTAMSKVSEQVSRCCINQGRDTPYIQRSPSSELKSIRGCPNECRMVTFE